MAKNNQTQYNDKSIFKEYDYKQIIDFGKVFLDAAKKCNKPNISSVGWSHPLLVPIITNMAFSCELFLKAILKHDNNDTKKTKTHNLKDLFNELQENIKSEIMKPYNEEDFMAKLENISNLFMEWRYLYERHLGSVEYNFLCDFSEKLLEIADNM